MARAVLRTDKVRSERVGHIYSVVDNVNDLENGFVGHLGDLITDEREIYQLEQPTTASIKEKPLVLINVPVVNYEEYRRVDNALGNFYIPAGTPARANQLEPTDIFSVSYEGVDLIGSEPTVGNYVVAQNGSYKLKEVADLIDNEDAVFVGKIIEKDTIGTTTVTGMAGAISRVTNFVVIQVIKNG